MTMRRSLRISSSFTIQNFVEGGTCSRHNRKQQKQQQQIRRIPYRINNFTTFLLKRRLWLRHLFVVAIVVCTILFVLNNRIGKDTSGDSTSSSLLRGTTGTIDNTTIQDGISGNHSIALIVAYRDLYAEQQRSDHLKKFVPFMIQFLDKCVSANKIRDYHIYIIEQTNDGYKFNRGKLMNIGYDYAIKRSTGSSTSGHDSQQQQQQQQQHDIFIFHDVDLLPQDNLIQWYTKYPVNPIHLAHPWPKYAAFSGFVGGIMSFSSFDYERINGFPNNFWGWGGEDDAIAVRLFRNSIPIIDATTGTFTDLEGTSRPEKIALLQKNTQWRNPGVFRLYIENFVHWKQNGLNTLQYSIESTSSLHNSTKATKVTTAIGLNGNNHWTDALAPFNSTEKPWFSWINSITDAMLYYF